MKLKIKDGTSLEQLREFGFRPGSELAAMPEFAPLFSGALEYQYSWWHKFLLDPDDPKKPYLTEDGLPIGHGWVKPVDGINLLCFDMTPDCTFHMSTDDLELITGTIMALTSAEILVPAEETHRYIGIIRPGCVRDAQVAVVADPEPIHDDDWRDEADASIYLGIFCGTYEHCLASAAAYADIDAANIELIQI